MNKSMVRAQRVNVLPQMYQLVTLGYNFQNPLQGKLAVATEIGTLLHHPHLEASSTNKIV